MISTLKADQMKAYHKKLDRLIKDDAINPSIGVTFGFLTLFSIARFSLYGRLYGKQVSDIWTADKTAPISLVIWTILVLGLVFAILFSRWVLSQPRKENYWVYDRLGIICICLCIAAVINFYASWTYDWLRGWWPMVDDLVLIVAMLHLIRYSPAEPDRIRVKMKGGKTGTIYDYEFDSKTMTRL